MTEVKVIKNIQSKSLDKTVLAGETISVSDKVAQSWIDAGLAEKTETEQAGKSPKTVPTTKEEKNFAQ